MVISRVIDGLNKSSYIKNHYMKEFNKYNPWLELIRPKQTIWPMSMKAFAAICTLTWNKKTCQITRSFREPDSPLRCFSSGLQGESYDVTSAWLAGENIGSQKKKLCGWRRWRNLLLLRHPSEESGHIIKRILRASILNADSSQPHKK